MIDFLPSREVALSLWGREIRWYGVLYVVGYVLAWWLMPRLQKYRKLALTADQWAVVMVFGVTGVLLGGRLGYVFFYEPVYFLSHGAEIFYIWMGGMSLHGGIVGVGMALWLVSKLLKVRAGKLF